MHSPSKQGAMVAVFLAGCCLAESPLAAGIQRLAPFSALTLRVSVPERDFVQLEPIPITLSISNDSERPISGHLEVSLAEEYARLYVTDEQGRVKEALPLPGVFADSVKNIPVPIEPGRQKNVTELLSVGLDETFPEPGL